ncbi:unnamed protein product [Prorocentrum cordatum]|uniref:C3H1-type domain-containing protein n=1 Tax=Prorocentrum cordatum TaxID=2364126 RepID=A0ABN9TJD3_9DINO|nr:unnamed protein product [Polarella glacialis]
MLLMQLPIQISGVPVAPAPQQGAAPADPRSLGEGPALGVAPPPPPLAVAGTASRGSKNHFRGQCRPCRFHEAPEKCPRGESCNFCHFPHGPEKFAELEAHSARARGRRPRTRTGSSESQSGQRLSLCDHLDLPGSSSGRLQPVGSSSICFWSVGKLAEAPFRGAAWRDLGADGGELLKAILLSAQPECYDD